MFYSDTVSCEITYSSDIYCTQETYDSSASPCFQETKQDLCLYSYLFPLMHFMRHSHIIHPSVPPTFFCSRLSLGLFSPSFPFHRNHAGWSARSVVLFNMHSPFLLLYYCPTGGRGPFLRPDNGRRLDREHGGHVPFATPRYLSILPPFSPTLFNSTLILLQERKTWEPSMLPKPPGPQLYTYY